MGFYAILTILIVLSAIFGFINVKYLRLPDTIGLMFITIVFTIGIVIAGKYFPPVIEAANTLVHQIDFKTALLDIMLSFLLFAGAMHTNFDQLKVQRYPILAFSTFGVLVSTTLVGLFMWVFLPLLSFNVPFIYCLLFGALISPTDPIAVLGILKKAGVPKKLETKIVGESLFNDGVGVVVFLTIFEVAKAGIDNFNIAQVGQLFVLEIGGGVILGATLGYIAYKMMKSIDNYAVEVMITIAIVMGGTHLAHLWHLSGPLAMVIAGLIVGHDTLRETTMSEITEQYVDKFWEMIDVFLNAILFVLIGLEMLVMQWDPRFIVAGIISILIVLFSRYLSLIGPIRFFREKLKFIPYTDVIMTWGGLRGGISIALALSLTDAMNRELFLTITYVIVVFSIIVQGLSVDKLVLKLLKESKELVKAGKDSSGH